MGLNPDCLARLRLRHPPFDELASEAFVYDDPLLDRMIETARESVLKAASVVLLCGPDGSGRSLQLMRLLGVLPESLTLVAFRGRAGIGFDVVEATIRNQLGAARSALEETLRLLLHPGAGVVLAVDDAHLLGTDVLHGLLQLRHKLLERAGDAPRLLLVGDASLERRELELGEFDGAHALVRLALRPFNLEQSGAYLLHRLGAAGLDNPQGLLSDADIEALHQRARGLPKALNALGNDWLEARCRDAGAIGESIADRLRALSDAVGDAVDDSRSKSLDEPPARARLAPAPSAPPPPARDPVSAPSAGSASQDAEETMATTAFAELMARIARESVAAPAPPEKSEDKPGEPNGKPRARTPSASRGKASAKKSAASGAAAPGAATPIWNRRWFVPAMAGGAALAIVVPLFFQLPKEKASEGDASRQAARALLEAAPEPGLSDAREREPVVAGVSPRLPPPAPQSAPPSGMTAPSREAGRLPLPAEEMPPPQLQEQPPAEPDVGRASRVDPPAATELANLEEGRAWLSGQNPERFTIQLIAVSSLEAAADYVARHRLGEVHYIPIRSRQRDLVVALAGAFADRAAAERAYRALPEEVRADQPWIRAIGSVRDSLR